MVATSPAGGGGIKAGTIYLEMVAEITRLQQDMAKVQQWSKAMQQNVSGDAMRTMKSLEGIAPGANKAAAGMDRTSGSSKMMAMQLSQVAQQGSATGQYLQALAIQLPDIAVGMSAAGASAGRFASFMGGPWGIALASGAAVLVPFIGKLFETADAADTARSALANLMQQRQRELQQQTQISTATKEVNVLIKERDMLEKRQALSSRGLNQGELNRLAFVRGEIFKNRDAIDSQRIGAGSLGRALDSLANANIKAEGATKRHTSASRAHSASIRAAKKDTDEFVTSLSEVAKGLGVYSNENLDNLFEQMNKIDTANQKAFGDQLARDNAERTKGLVEAVEATAAWNDQMQETVRLLDRIGGAGSKLGDIGSALYAMRTQDYSAVSGPAGHLIQQLAGIEYVKLDPTGTKEISTSLGKEFALALDGVFGGEGSFTKVLQGAGTGAAVGQVLFSGNQAGQIGSMIGGAIGTEVGKTVLGGVLGKLGGAAGPLGAIAGSILGGVIGGLFKGDKYGTSNLSSSGVMAGRNNNSEMAGQAGSLADQAFAKLQQVADALGVTMGKFSNTIAITNGKINFNPGTVSGKVGTTFQRDTVDFGQNTSALLEAFFKDAISDGVFNGASEGVQRLIKNGGDIEAQLQKALSFKAVFDELDQLKDPQGFALKGLDQWRSSMDAIFAEAGATAEQLAQLEELTGLKRKEIVERYGEEIANAEDLTNQRRAIQIQILELEGNRVAALTLARQAELDAADASLRPLMDRRNALLDEAEASNRVLSLQQRYSRAIGDDATARAIERMQELNGAQTEQERSMLRSIYAAEDLVEKQDNLTSAYSSQMSALSNYIDKLYEGGRAMRALSDELQFTMQTADADTSRRAIQAAMKAGDTDKLPALIKAYLPQAMDRSGSLADYQREIAWLSAGSQAVADLSDRRADYSAALFGDSMRRSLGWEGPQIDWTPLIEAITAASDKVNSTVEQGNKDRVNLGVDQLREQRQTRQTLDQVTDGGVAIYTQANN